MEKQDYKKVRILSFQNAYNFGAVLQAYGLQQTLKSMGYNDVKFIKYNPKYLSDRYNPFLKKHFCPKKSIRGIIGWGLNLPFFLVSRINRNRHIQLSIDSLLEQTHRLVIDEKGLEEEEADVLICGSDQIWNISLTGSFDPIFMGKGPYKHLGYAVSYAPSTELSSLTDENAKILCKYLDSFRYISVRETQVKAILEKYLDKDIQVCVDPTLLCGADAFHQIASHRLEKREYIVVYAYNPKDTAILEMIKSIPDYKKYSIHYILLGSKNRKNFFDFNSHASITVQDFLSYIKYAKYVITNSFHGLAFSLLFEKNFNVAFCEGKYIRCLSLLQQLDLDSRFVKDMKTCNWTPLDYSLIKQRLDEIRKVSHDYLKKVLEG